MYSTSCLLLRRLLDTRVRRLRPLLLIMLLLRLRLLLLRLLLRCILRLIRRRRRRRLLCSCMIGMRILRHVLFLPFRLRQFFEKKEQKKTKK